MATLKTADHLIDILKRGAELRDRFIKEWKDDDTRFLKPVKRIKVENFASENVKRRYTKDKKALNAAEGVRDAFGYLLRRISLMEESNVDLREILTYPVTEVPLSIPHADETPTKTDKANLTRILESKIDAASVEEYTFQSVLFDVGLGLHEILPHHTKSTYGTIVRDIMVKVCSATETTVHLLLDRYQQPSIKDIEHLKRGTILTQQETFKLFSGDQKQRQKGCELLKNGMFKDEL